MKNFAFLITSILYNLTLLAQTQIGQDIKGETKRDQSGFSVSISSDGSKVAIGTPYNDGNGTSAGHVRIYTNENGNWIQVGSDIDGEAAGDESGYSISLSGDGEVVAIGSPLNAGNGVQSGQVRVYKNTNNSWTQVGDDINGEAAGDQSGFAVSLSKDGRVVAVGARYNKGNGAKSGHVRVFEYDKGKWIQLGTDIDGESGGSVSGTAVSLNSNGTFVAIGAPLNGGNGTNAGQVRVYKYENKSWKQIGIDVDGEELEQIGSAVSLSADGSVFAAGAPFSDGGQDLAGVVRVYKNVEGKWVQVGKDIIGEADGDLSGGAISLSGDGNVVAVGANKNNGKGFDAGHVRLYKNDGGRWVQTGLEINGESEADYFGQAVSFSEDARIVAIGAPGNDANGDAAGKVRVYQLPEEAEDFEAIKLSGFNHDIIAEGTVGNSVVVTSNTFDLPDVIGNNHVLYTKEYRYSAAEGHYGLSNDGIINSLSNPGINYQLADYSGNNVLLLIKDDSKTLTFTNPQVYNRLSILAASANAASSLTLTVHYSDDSTEELHLLIPLWDSAGNYAVQGFGRVVRVKSGNVFEGDSTSPRLYDNLLKVNKEKLITKLTFSKIQSDGRAGIFAICGLTPVGVPAAPESTQATSVIPETGFTANWKAVVEATGYRIDVAGDSNFTNMLGSYNNLDVGDVTTFGINVTKNKVFYRVRAYNSKGQSTNSEVITVTFGSTLIMDVVSDVIQFYPNPTAGKWVKVITDFQGEITLEVYGSTGNLIRTSTGSANEVQIIEFITPGLYFIVVQNSAGQKFTKKVMVL